MKPPQKTVETVEQTGRKWPKSGPWTLEAKLRTRRPGVRIPHGVPITAIFLRECRRYCVLAPRGIRSLCPGGVNPSWRAKYSGFPFGRPLYLRFPHPEGVEVYAPEGQLPHGVQNPTDFFMNSVGFCRFLSCSLSGICLSSTIIQLAPKNPL